jgi:hypothetical protein
MDATTLVDEAAKLIPQCRVGSPRLAVGGDIRISVHGGVRPSSVMWDLVQSSFFTESLRWLADSLVQAAWRKLPFGSAVYESIWACRLQETPEFKALADRLEKAFRKVADDPAWIAAHKLTLKKSRHKNRVRASLRSFRKEAAYLLHDMSLEDLHAVLLEEAARTVMEG